MPFEDLDSKIKQAADQHHPNYDERAWAKMEKLLDRHMPLKQDRIRFTFFLLGFLLLGGGAWLVITKPWQQSDQIPTVVNTPHKTGAGPSEGSAKDITTANSSPEEKKDQESIIDPVNVNEKKNDLAVKDVVVRKQEKDQDLTVSESLDNRGTNRQVEPLRGSTDKTDQLAIGVTDPGKIIKDRNPSENNPTISAPASGNEAVPKDDIKTMTDLPAGNNDISQNKTADTKKSDIIEEKPKASDDKKVAQKSPGKKSNSFFFSFSAGPDISSIGAGSTGKVQLSLGAGLGYTFKNRLTLRTGFYAGGKLYSANKEQYKPDVAPPNYNNLEKIDADCKVYEIPVSLAWNFSQSKEHSLFAAAGLSSYIMKKETYNYLYHYTGSQPWTYTKILNNENKHYFSVLTLSGGYQRRINKVFSVAAEPYVKLPLTGIGYGNVKLNSAGILFSINISPFQPGAKK